MGFYFRNISTVIRDKSSINKNSQFSIKCRQIGGKKSAFHGIHHLTLRTQDAPGLTCTDITSSSIFVDHFTAVTLMLINPLPPSEAVRQQKKNILEDLFSLVFSQCKKYHPSRNLKFKYLGIF